MLSSGYDVTLASTNSIATMVTCTRLVKTGPINIISQIGEGLVRPYLLLKSYK